MSQHPLKVFERIDPEFHKLVENNRAFALNDGVLSRKVKLLIAMALDAVEGTVNGVNALAKEAMKAGATKEEITEALRVAQFINGVGSTYTAGRALGELF